MPDALRSPLADYHVSHGVALSAYRGALTPARFSDPAAEHQAVRNAAGVFDFSFRAKIAVAGPDRATFLHNMLSNDVKALTPDRGIYATLLDIKGHILADLRVYHAGDVFLLDTDADLRAKAIEILNRYIVMDDVTLTPVATWSIAVQGPRSRAVVEQALGVRVPALAEFDHFAASTSGRDARVVRATGTGEEGYEVWVDAGGLIPLWEALLEKARGVGGLSCGSEALESLRIEAGIPRYGVDFGEDTLPLEAGLLNALSFTKGCYVGQEIVERARSRGHVNWKLVGLIVEGAPPAPGEKLLSGGREVGEVTSSCASPTLSKTLALAYARREASDAGTKLVVASGASAEVAAVPFYPPRLEGAAPKPAS